VTTNADACTLSRDDQVELVSNMPSDRDVVALAELFRVLGDPTRVRIISVLQQRSLCVNDIAGVLGMNQTAVSHQLKVLRHNRLVRYERRGRSIIYSLDDDHVVTLFRVGREHVEEYSL
jgi:DNA-binding transcriptional ArsR family regulator